MGIKNINRQELDIILQSVRRERDERLSKELKESFKALIKETMTEEKESSCADRRLEDIENVSEAVEENSFYCSGERLMYDFSLITTFNNLINKLEELYYNTGV